MHFLFLETQTLVLFNVIFSYEGLNILITLTQRLKEIVVSKLNIIQASILYMAMASAQQRKA
jgi:hypothetical protein